MEKTLSILLFFLSFTILSIAQNDRLEPATIIGRIVDNATGTPLEYSTITLLNHKNNTILTGGISNSNGAFSIQVTQKYFSLKIEYIGYQPKTIHKIKIADSKKKIDLGLIKMESDIAILDELEVRAEKSTVVLKLDKRVFNVGKDLVSAGGTAEDIMRNVPGVFIDIDGNIGLRSNGGVRILLNGRPSSLLNDKNSSGLRQIQANQIDRIEVITNPSSRYEAQGMSGIINIILKSNQEKGLNGSINANFGQPDNYGIGFNLNYHKNKINWFLGVGGYFINRPGTGSFRNQFYNINHPDSTLYSSMDRTHERKSLLGYTKFGADYYLNTKNIFNTSFSYRTSDGDNPSKLVYKDAYGNADNVFLVTERLEDEKEEERNLSYILTYKKLFSSKEHTLTTDIQYESRREEEISAYDESFFDQNNLPFDADNFNQLSNNEESNKQFIIRSDYVFPFKKESKLELGFQSSVRNITNNYRVREVVNNIEIPDSNFTNNFKYREVIHGIYGNYGKKINKFSFQLGVRAEHSNVYTDLLLSNENNTSQYINLFPSTFFTYDFPDDNAIQLSYSQRIERPTFWDLNPFFTVRDRRNIFRGNPNIEPELSHSYELGHVKYWEKGSISSIAYFRVTDNVIKRIQRVDKNNPEITITQAENLNIKRNYGVELTYSLSPNKWWRLNGDMNLFHSLSKGTYKYAGQEVFVGGQSFSMNTKINSSFIFWEKIHTQLTFSYKAPRTTTQGINKSTTAMDFVTSLDIFQNKGTLTLSINDVFNSRRRRSFSEDDSFRSEDNFLWQSRAIVLAFNYRLNQKKNSSHIYIYPNDEDDDEKF